MEVATGTIVSTRNGGAEGVIQEDGTGAQLSFINPRIPSVGDRERYEFLKIIQSTPNGSQVINILKSRLP
ncbi:MAG: hypothetical protein ACOZCO_16615 [Bacteroidota bacterium]